MRFEGRRPDAREIVVIAVMAAIAACGNLAFFMIPPFQEGTALVIIAGICLGPEEGFLTGAMARLVVNMFMSQGPWTPWQMFCWGLLGFLGGICFNKDQEFMKKEVHFKVIMGPLICIIISLALGFGIWILLDTQGPFVGWWLYGFGAIGLLAGVMLQRKRMPVDRLTLAVFGFLLTFIIYGGIMNVATLVMSSGISGSGIGLDWGSLKILYISCLLYTSCGNEGTHSCHQ